ncbi:MAG: DNA-formamidopyrimidine glycosylase [Candidatus Omnitrophota bacterium]|nr:DNA-formamidopyrimidine glycosylase [Candidatus Omnitrophota bacterium]
MPELPEAETIKRELKDKVLGKKIVKVIINNPKVIRTPASKNFARKIAGARINGVLRKGKAIILELSCAQDLVVQLGMTGQLIYPGQAKTSRVSFLLSDGKILDYNDQRMFGGLSLLSRHEELEYIKNLGPEPFDLKPEDFKKLLVGKKTKIKVLLMDQQFISGVGNIYANEALFRAGIPPERPANSLTGKEQTRLLTEIKDSLNEAIKYNGSSVDNYVRLSGEKGRYVPHLKVYGRDGKACLKCKTVIKKITLAGRGTYFCPKCQPKAVDKK